MRANWGNKIPQFETKWETKWEQTKDSESIKPLTPTLRWGTLSESCQAKVLGLWNEDIQLLVSLLLSFWTAVWHCRGKQGQERGPVWPPHIWIVHGLHVMLWWETCLLGFYSCPYTLATCFRGKKDYASGTIKDLLFSASVLKIPSNTQHSICGIIGNGIWG